MPSTAFRSSTPARDTALAEPKCFISARLRCGPMPAISSSGLAPMRLRALGAMRADGEAVRLVAQALDKVEHGIARLEHDRPVAAGKMEVLAAGVALGPLGDAHHADVVQAEIGQHLAGDRELSGATVDQHEIGPIGKCVVVIRRLGPEAGGGEQGRIHSRRQQQPGRAHSASPFSAASRRKRRVSTSRIMA